MPQRPRTPTQAHGTKSQSLELICEPWPGTHAVTRRLSAATPDGARLVRELSFAPFCALRLLTS
jgi:hypothetical protein